MSNSSFIANLKAQDEATRAHLEATRQAPQAAPVRPTYFWTHAPAAGI